MASTRPWPAARGSRPAVAPRFDERVHVIAQKKVGEEAKPVRADMSPLAHLLHGLRPVAIGARRAPIGGNGVAARVPHEARPAILAHEQRLEVELSRERYLERARRRDVLDSRVGKRG